MPQQEKFVVFDPVTTLYLIVYTGEAGTRQWGNSKDAITFDTLVEAQNLATSIGGGTVGTTKPK
jgi:hypothetical protein